MSVKHLPSLIVTLACLITLISGCSQTRNECSQARQEAKQALENLALFAEGKAGEFSGASSSSFKKVTKLSNHPEDKRRLEPLLQQSVNARLNQRQLKAIAIRARATADMLGSTLEEARISIEDFEEQQVTIRGYDTALRASKRFLKVCSAPAPSE